MAISFKQGDGSGRAVGAGNAHIEISVRDKGEWFKQLDAFPEQRKIVTARAINKTAAWTKTRMVDMGKEALSVPVSAIRSNVAITKAKPDYLLARVKMEGKRIPLMLFRGGPKTRPTRHGINYQITPNGGVKTIEHNAFVAEVRGKLGFWKRSSANIGHEKVIAKSGKRAGKYIWSQRKINPLYGPSVVKVLEDSPKFKQLVEVDAAARLDLMLERESSFLLTGTSKLPGGSDV